MFQWDGCPLDLFDIYLEVGEVKVRRKQGKELIGIELWIGSCFRNPPVRPEFARIVRRPVYGILKQIRKLSENRQICLLIMCDDTEGWGNDTTNWSGALFLLMRELKKYSCFRYAVMFTRKSWEQIQEGGSVERFRSESARREYLALYDALDVLVTRQANLYSCPDNRKLWFRDAAGWDAVKELTESCKQEE